MPKVFGIHFIRGSWDHVSSASVVVEHAWGFRLPRLIRVTPKNPSSSRLDGSQPLSAQKASAHMDMRLCFFWGSVPRCFVGVKGNQEEHHHFGGGRLKMDTSGTCRLYAAWTTTKHEATN